MGSRCLLVIFVSGNNRLPVPPASTTPFISSYHTVMSMWGRLANPGQPPYFRQTAPEIGWLSRVCGVSRPASLKLELREMVDTQSAPELSALGHKVRRMFALSAAKIQIGKGSCRGRV